MLVDWCSLQLGSNLAGLVVPMTTFPGFDDYVENVAGTI